jgi:hypothetical protein
MTNTDGTLGPPRDYRAPDDPRLPRFSTYDEEAALWEGHDFDTLEPLASEELSERASIEQAWRAERTDPSRRLSISLDRSAYDALAEAARSRGVEPETLAGMWLRERLRSA